MDRSPPPPKRKGTAAHTRSRLLHNLSDQDNDSLTLKNARRFGKSSPRRQKLTDTWIEGKIEFFAGEVSRLDAGSVARLFMRKARTEYRRYRGTRCPRRRRLCWQYIQTVAAQLVGKRAPSMEEPLR